MNEHFRGKRLWIVLGALALVGLCLMLCLVAAAFAALHPGQSHRVVLDVQPTAVQEGDAAALTYQGPFGWGMDRPRSFGLVRRLFRVGLCTLPLLFLGLILFLAFILVRRRCWGREYWGAPPGSRPPEGENRGGPWAWHKHSHPWAPPPGSVPAPEPPGEQSEPEEPDTAGE
ncbi:MAG: hypothetical protein JXM73_05830 [Anaerolineae bacterium]|nr:hypothetical protein [Anaerolineae bacterium]